jgi:hypothetical protein
MTTRYNIAKIVVKKLPKTADRYDQIFAIKQALFLKDMKHLATDREYIDDVLDILFNAYGYPA